ncbi:MAG: dTMP kinase [Candidatus Caldarchaeum sp.]
MHENTIIVVWEGVDAAGKTTLLEATSERLRSRGMRVEAYKTPSNTETGGFATSHGNQPTTDPLTRMLLFLANTSDDSAVIKKIIHEKRPDYMFLDRYYACSIVYGFALIGRKLGKTMDDEKLLTFYRLIEEMGSDVFVRPDLTIVVEVDEQTRRRRVQRKHEGSDRSFEGDEMLQNLVRRYYVALLKNFDNSFVRVLNEDSVVDTLSDELAGKILSLRRV